MKKTETVAEFLARGGKITRLPPGETIQKQDSNVKPATGGPVTILTMDDASLYYGETRAKPKKAKKQQPTLDISALPEELRKKFVDGVLNAQKEDEDFED